MALGGGLGGPMVEEDEVGPCDVLLWWQGEVVRMGARPLSSSVSHSQE